MASDSLGLTDAESTGTPHADSPAHDMSSRISSLIQEMADDHKAVAGSTMPAFHAAQTELTEALDGLMQWCQTRGVDLSQGQRAGNDQDPRKMRTLGGAR